MRCRFVATTDSNHDGPIFPKVAAGLAPTGPISSGLPTSPYISMQVDFIYLAVALDTWSRRVVGSPVGVKVTDITISDDANGGH